MLRYNYYKYNKCGYSFLGKKNPALYFESRILNIEFY